jgi:hypothetical protein
MILHSHVWLPSELIISPLSFTKFSTVVPVMFTSSNFNLKCKRGSHISHDLNCRLEKFLMGQLDVVRRYFWM